MVYVFAEVWRVLRPDGTLWVSGITGMVALNNNRASVLCEINDKNLDIIRKRCPQAFVIVQR